MSLKGKGFGGKNIKTEFVIKTYLEKAIEKGLKVRSRYGMPTLAHLPRMLRFILELLKRNSLNLYM